MSSRSLASPSVSLAASTSLTVADRQVSGSRSEAVTGGGGFVRHQERAAQNSRGVV